MRKAGREKEGRDGGIGKELKKTEEERKQGRNLKESEFVLEFQIYNCVTQCQSLLPRAARHKTNRGRSVQIPLRIDWLSIPLNE